MTTRRRGLRGALALLGAQLLALVLGCGLMGEEDDTPPPVTVPVVTVLSRVEELAPVTDPALQEPYERQMESNDLIARARAAGVEPSSWLQEFVLPPTRTDVLLCDFRMTANVDLGMGVLDQTVTDAQMAQVVDFYVRTDYMNIRGYRPRAHQNFIMGLSEADRAQLAREAGAHVRQNGFQCPAS